MQGLNRGQHAQETGYVGAFMRERPVNEKSSTTIRKERLSHEHGFFEEKLVLPTAKTWRRVPKEVTRNSSSCAVLSGHRCGPSLEDA
jgi:hypothetical protein